MCHGLSKLFQLSLRLENVVSSTSNAGKAFTARIGVRYGQGGRAIYLLWLLPTSCDVLWIEPFLALLCQFGLLTVLPVLGCGGLYLRYNPS